MLLTEWQSFKEARAPVAPITAQPQATLPGLDTSDVIPEAPRVSDNPVSDAVDDLPSVAAPVADPTAQDTTAAQGSIVTISSDVLRLSIDLKGGDIIYAAFPQYPAQLDQPDSPFVLLQQDQQRVYIAQSGLVGSNGIDSDGRAQFSAAGSSFEMDEGQDTLVVDLHHNSEQVKVIKRFTLHRGDHLVDVEYLLENNSGERWQGNLFGQIKRDGSTDPSQDNQSGMGMMPFLGTALTQPDDRFTKFDFDDMAEKPFKGQLPGGWIAMIQHYFLSAWIPNPEQTHTYTTRRTNAGFYIGGFVSPTLVIDPGKTGSVAASFYAGPKDQYRLKEISEYLDLSVDYGWLFWIAQPLFWLLTNIYSLVGNWGVAIILLTVLIKAAFFQLSAASYKSMANMRRVQPQMTSIRERYAEDKQKQSQEMMELYKKEKINPLGGCLPILVQMPVFIALYWVLMESVELRHAPFALWINDLSVMDPYFVLPLASMFFQQKLNPPPPDPMQAKVMQWMPIVFTFFFLWFPAGLVLYWVANNLLSMAQQYVITRRIEKAAGIVK
jgi:YidC/Oxa1 family membrane protein insertase